MHSSVAIATLLFAVSFKLCGSQTIDPKSVSDATKGLRGVHGICVRRLTLYNSQMVWGSEEHLPSAVLANPRGEESPPAERLHTGR